VNSADPSGLFGLNNIYKWIYTGNCNSSDEAYQGALDTAASTGECELGCIASTSEDFLGVAGVSTWFIAGGPVKRIVIFDRVIFRFGPRLANSSSYTSWARILTNVLLKRLTASGYSVSESLKILDNVGVRRLATFINGSPKVIPIYVAIAALYIEAAISAYCSSMCVKINRRTIWEV